MRTWGEWQLFPDSALTLKDIVTHDISQLADLDREAIKALAKEFSSKVKTPQALEKLKLPTDKPLDDLEVPDSTTEVTTSDPLVMQMREVLSVLDDALKNDTPVPENIKKINAHIMVKTARSLRAKAKSQAPDQTEQPGASSGVTQPSTSGTETSVQYSMKLSLMMDALNALSPTLHGAVLAAGVADAAAGKPSGSQAADQQGSEAEVGGIAGSVLGLTASAFLTRMASSVRSSGAGASSGASSLLPDEAVTEEEVQSMLDEIFFDEVQELLKKAPPPPQHEPGETTGEKSTGSEGSESSETSETTEEDSPGSKSRGKGKGQLEPACRRKRALAGTGKAAGGASECSEWEKYEKMAGEGAGGLASTTVLPTLIYRLGLRVGLGIAARRLLMIGAAAVAAGVAGWLIGKGIAKLRSKDKDEDDATEKPGNGRDKPTPAESGHDQDKPGTEGPTDGKPATTQQPTQKPVTDKQANDHSKIADVDAGKASSTTAVGIASSASMLSAKTSATTPNTLPPVSSDPASSNPVSSNPASSNPASLNPASLNPASLNPASLNPASSNPAFSNTVAQSEVATSEAGYSTIATKTQPLSTAFGVSRIPSDTAASSATRSSNPPDTGTTALLSPSKLISTPTSSVTSTHELSMNATTSPLAALTSSVHTSESSIVTDPGTSNALSSLGNSMESPVQTASLQLRSTDNSTLASPSPSDMESTRALSMNAATSASAPMGLSVNTTAPTTEPVVTSPDISTALFSTGNTTSSAAQTSSHLSPVSSTAQTTLSPSVVTSSHEWPINATSSSLEALSSAMNASESSMESYRAISSTLSSPGNASESPAETASVKLSLTGNSILASPSLSDMESTRSVPLNATTAASAPSGLSVNATESVLTSPDISTSLFSAGNTTASAAQTSAMQLSPMSNTTQASLSPSGVTSTYEWPMNATTSPPEALSSAVNASESSVETRSTISGTFSSPVNTTESPVETASVELSSVGNSTQMSHSASDMESTRSVSLNATASTSAPSGLSVNSTESVLTSPDISTSLFSAGNTTQASLSPSGVTSTYEWPMNATTSPPEALSSAVNASESSVETHSTISGTFSSPVNTTESPVETFSVELSSVGNSTQMSRSASDMESTQSVSLNATTSTSASSALSVNATESVLTSPDIITTLFSTGNTTASAAQTSAMYLSPMSNTTQASLSPSGVTSTHEWPVNTTTSSPEALSSSVLNANESSSVETDPTISGTLSLLVNTTESPVETASAKLSSTANSTAFATKTTSLSMSSVDDATQAEPGLSGTPGTESLPPHISTSTPAGLSLTATPEPGSLSSVSNISKDASMVKSGIQSSPSDSLTPSASVIDTRESRLGMQSKQLLKLYANEVTGIYNDFLTTAHKIETLNDQQMQQLPENDKYVYAGGKEFLQWPYARLQCLGYNFAALTEQIENSFRATYQYTDAYINYIEARAKEAGSDDLASDISIVKAMVVSDLANQFLNMYSLYSARRHDMFQSTGFAGEEGDSVYLQGFSAFHLAEGVEAVLRDQSPTGLFGEVLSSLSGYLKDEARASENPDTGHDMRTPQPDKALRTAIAGVTEPEQIPVLPRSHTPEIQEMLRHITFMEREGYLTDLSNIESAGRLRSSDYMNVITHPDRYQEITRGSGVACSAEHTRRMTQKAQPGSSLNTTALATSPTITTASSAGSSLAKTPQPATPLSISNMAKEPSRVKSGIQSTPSDSLTPSASVIDTRESRLGMQSKQLLKLYANEVTGIYNDLLTTAHKIETLNDQQMQQLPENDKYVYVGDEEFLQWPYARLQCLGYNLAVLTEQIENSFRATYQYTDAYINYIEARAKEAGSDGLASDISTVKAMVVSDLANQFLNIYSLYSARRHDMFQSTGFAGEEGDSVYLQGFSAFHLAAGVEAVLRDQSPTGLFSEVLSSLLGYLKDEARASENPDTGHDMRTPQPDKALRTAIAGVTEPEQMPVLPRLQTPEIQGMLHHIISAEGHGYLDDLSGMTSVRQFPASGLSNVIMHPDEYQEITRGSGVACSAEHTRRMTQKAPAGSSLNTTALATSPTITTASSAGSGLAETPQSGTPSSLSNMATEPSRVPSGVQSTPTDSLVHSAAVTDTPESHLGIQSKRLLRHYANKATGIYHDYVRTAHKIETLNDQQMQQLPENNQYVYIGEEEFLQWPYARLQCMGYNLAALTEQFENSFREAYLYTDAYINYIEAQAEEAGSDEMASDLSTVKAMVVNDLTHQFLNMYSLYSATRHDLFRSTGFAGEGDDSLQLRGFSVFSLGEGIEEVQRHQSPTGLFGDVLSGLLGYLGGEAMASENPDTGHDMRTPRPDSALRAAIAGVTEQEDMPVLPRSQTPEIGEMLHHITFAEREGYLDDLSSIESAGRFLSSDYMNVITHPDRYQEITRGSEATCSAEHTREMTQKAPVGQKSKQLLKFYADKASLINGNYSQQIDTITHQNSQQMLKLPKNDRMIKLGGKNFLQWPYARLICCGYHLRALNQMLASHFLNLSGLADKCVNYYQDRALTTVPDFWADDLPLLKSTVTGDLTNQFLNMYSLYSAHRHSLIEATGFAGDQGDSEFLQGFDFRAMDHSIRELLREPIGLSLPFRAFLQDLLSNYLDKEITGDHGRNPNDLRVPQPNEHLQTLIHDTSAGADAFDLPDTDPFTSAEAAAINTIIRKENDGFLSLMSTRKDDRYFPGNYMEFLQNPDKNLGFLQGLDESCRPETGRKRRHLDRQPDSGRESINREPMPDPAMLNEHHAPATAGAASHKGLLSTVRDGMSWLTGSGDATERPQPQAMPGITTGQEQPGSADHRVNGVRPAQPTVDDGLLMASLAVSHLTDRPVRSDLKMAAIQGQVQDRDDNPPSFDRSPGMQLLKGSLGVARQLRTEVTAFVDRVRDAQLQPDAHWETDDLLNMAIVAANSDRPANCTEAFLDEVLFSPGLGVEHEHIANIFDSDGRVRGTRGNGRGIFFGPDQDNAAASGPARQLGQCMLSAMADRQLDQVNSTERRDAIIDQALGLQEQQARGVMGQLSAWLGGNTPNQDQRRRELAQRLERRLSPVTGALSPSPSPSPSKAGDDCIRQLNVGDYQSARASFLKLSDERQRQAIQSLTELPDLFGLEPQWDDLGPKDSQAAWQRFTALYDSKFAVKEEAMNRMKLAAMIDGHKVTGQPDEAQQLAAQIIHLLPVQQSASQRALGTSTAKSGTTPVFRQHQYDRDKISSMLEAYKTIRKDVTRLLPQHFIAHTLAADLQEEIIALVAIDSLRSLRGKASSKQQRQAEIVARLTTEAEEFIKTQV
ncbi:hypothetical protein [Endozoicomonas sp. SCSIO W0465]|uniref:hypothetical protein n=1 Tax=Endozoicomonas sp. SCSIO W0465 TaxID=2918516 RepID=UPI0020759060|nr:hypothetical protein [Endozoicomonas sp. SCSIO W0465]USE38978.1 hypothetical protein MJO57_12915 [Endozoicomonas sp. SCSIO W0465]